MQHANSLASGNQGFRKFSAPEDQNVQPLVVTHKAICTQIKLSSNVASNAIIDFTTEFMF